MSRLAVAAALLLSGLTTHAAHAQDVPDDDTITAAHDAGLDPIDLLGALNTERTAGYDVDARTYLQTAADELARPPASVARGYTARVRLTYYAESGLTYSGGHTYAGSTACSWNWPIGTRFRLPDGEIVLCNDRGRLGSAGWLDLFRRPDLARAYGPYATVEVLP